MTLLLRNKPNSIQSFTKLTPISKSKKFEIPAKYLENKNQVASIVNWWFHCLSETKKKTDLTYQSQLRPAKKLLEKYDFIEILYAIRKVMGGRYTPSLWAILKNPKWAGLE